MLSKLIFVFVVLLCSIIMYYGVLKPLYSNLIAPILARLIHFFTKKLEKTPLEKEQESLRLAQEEMKAVELQKQRVRIEKQAMQVRDSIIEEEFEELDNEHKRSQSKLV